MSTTDGAATARRAGVVLFFAGYTPAYLAAVADPTNLGWMFAPIAGPWLALGHVDKGDALIIIDGALQAAGALVLIGGFASAGQQLVREPPSLALVPSLALPSARGRAHTGLTLLGTF